MAHLYRPDCQYGNHLTTYAKMTACVMTSVTVTEDEVICRRSRFGRWQDHLRKREM